MPARVAQFATVGPTAKGRVFGHPQQVAEGRWHTVTFGGTAGPRGEWIQVDLAGPRERMLRGFSGAGVVVDNQVVGILVAAHLSAGDLAWMIPMEAIAAHWRPLQSHLSGPRLALRRRLVEAALAIPVLSDVTGRNLLVDSLPQILRDVLPRNAAMRMDVVGIVNTCLSRPGGLQALAETLILLDGGSRHLNEFLNVAGEIDPQIQALPGVTTPQPVDPPSTPTEAPQPAISSAADGADSSADTGVVDEVDVAELDDDDQLRREISTKGFGDRPATEDALQREAFIETLVELIAHRPSGGALADSAGPTVIAVEGSWGTGKSSLIEMVRARLEERNEKPGPLTVRQRWRARRLRAWDADIDLGGWHTTAKLLGRLLRLLPEPTRPTAPRFLTVTFNPWSYQTSEQVWAGLTDAIVRAAEPALGPVESVRERTRERYWFGRNVRQVDRRRLQKTLRQWAISPILRLAVFALPVPILAQLVRTPTPYTIGPWTIAPVDLALWTVAALLGAGILHTVWRYITTPATAVLPGDLFTRPIATGAVAAATAGSADAVVHDPYYQARSGFLYLAQHDVFNLLTTIEEAGSQLIVCIDDLDRCSPRTTADVFEAINVFLGQSYPTTRFLIGLDSAAVSVHVDAAYEKLAQGKGEHKLWPDPTLGWSFLRKLIQLPVLVPRTTATHVEPVLRHLLGPTSRPIAGPPSAPVAEDAERVPPDDIPASVQPDDGASDTGTSQAVAALEADERVRRRLAERLCAQPDLSVREAKRILTLWQFYVRVLDRLPSTRGMLGITYARHLVILAEIVARWPAWQRRLHRRVDGTHGLHLLAAAVTDDDAWAHATATLGLNGNEAAGFVDELRPLLRDYDGKAVADLAELLT